MRERVCDHIVNIQSSFFLLWPDHFYSNLIYFYVFLMNILSSRICLRILTLKKKNYLQFREISLFFSNRSVSLYSSSILSVFLKSLTLLRCSCMDIEGPICLSFPESQGLFSPQAFLDTGSRDRVLVQWMGQWRQPAGFHVGKMDRKQPGEPGILSVAKIRIQFLGLYDFGRHAFCFLSSSLSARWKSSSILGSQHGFSLRSHTLWFSSFAKQFAHLLRDAPSGSTDSRNSSFPAQTWAWERNRSGKGLAPLTRVHAVPGGLCLLSHRSFQSAMERHLSHRGEGHGPPGGQPANTQTGLCHLPRMWPSQGTHFCELQTLHLWSEYHSIYVKGRQPFVRYLVTGAVSLLELP